MKDCVIASISDLHFGHVRTTTARIIQSLNQIIIKDRLLEKIDILVLAGDVFDHLLELNHPDLPDIDIWIVQLLMNCAHHGVALIVIEGTKSHDREQSERFVTLFEILELKDKMVFHYVNTVDIIYLEKQDAHVLCVPDDFRPTTAETLAIVRETLASRGRTKVDFAVMHGMFEFQAPPGIKGIPVHDQAAYEEFVEVVIFIGHDHRHKRNGIVLVQGSPERLAHGEEEPKGFVIAHIKNNKFEAFFIENKLARHYKTVQCYGMDLEQSLAWIGECVSQYQADAFIRIEAEPSHILFSNMTTLAVRHPGRTWSKLAKEKNTEKINPMTSEDENLDWKPLHIDRHNVEAILMERMGRKTLPAGDQAIIQQELRELL